MRTKATLLVAALVALAVLLSFGIAVKDAKADALLFPWIVKSPTVSTLISVVNTAEPFGQNQSLADPVLHYQYWLKDGATAGQTDSCFEVNFERPTSKDDIVTFDAAGNINSGKKLFNDPTDYTVGNVENFNITGPALARAFLIVDNNIPQAFTDVIIATNADGTLYGEAMVIEMAGGAAWGYIAYNASGGVTNTPFKGVSFEDGVDQLGEVIGVFETTQTVWMPPTTANTRVFMTPANFFAQDGGNMRAGNINNRIQLCAIPSDLPGPNGVTCLAGGIFDADENIISFENRKNVVCTSADDLVRLFGAAGAGAFDQWANQIGTQGWSYVNVLFGTVGVVPGNPVTFPTNTGSGMIINKLEFTTAGVSIDGTSIPGTLNSNVWLRDSESLGFFGSVTPCVQSLPCGGGINCIHNVRTLDFERGPFGPFDPDQCNQGNQTVAQ